MPEWLQPLIIFFAQLFFVPLMTMRVILVVKSMRKEAALISLFEASIYVLSLGIVFNNLDNLWNMVAYALGFSLGIYLGGLLEDKLRIGYLTYQINLLHEDPELVKHLRELGFGVTVFTGQGINESRWRLDVLAKRDRSKELEHLLFQEAPKAFIVSYEPKSFHGGFLTKAMKKKRKRNKKDAK